MSVVEGSVSVSNENLFKKEYRYALLQVAAGKFESSFRSLTELQRFEVEKIALKQCEIQHRVLASPEASNVVVLPDRLEEEVQTIISRYPSEAEFETELAENRLDIEIFPSLVERSIRVEETMKFVGSKAEACSGISAQLYYYMNTEKFKQPEFRKARHILITINPDFAENTREQVIKKSSELAVLLQKKPSRFAEKARKHSECPTAMNGGDLGLLKKGVLFPSLDKKLFEMEVGEVSDIVESPMGVHILLCDELQKEGLVDVDEALPQIIEKISERNRKKYQRVWLSELFKAG